MSRTKRVYNAPNKYNKVHGFFFHPWHQFCCGNCPTHKAGKIRELRTAKLAKRIIAKEMLTTLNY